MCHQVTNNADKAEELLKRADEVDDPAGVAGVKKDGGRLVLLGKADMSGGVRETVRGGACCSGCTPAFVCLELRSQSMSEGQWKQGWGRTCHLCSLRSLSIRCTGAQGVSKVQKGLGRGKDGRVGVGSL